jgi:mannan endo-1,4-beta-mannosidase
MVSDVMAEKHPKWRACLFAALLLSASAHAGDRVVPADTNANHDVRAILAWLHALPNRPERRVVSGQYGWADTHKTFVVTGVWPALYEDCFWQIGSSTWENWPLAEKSRERMKAYWDKGGLVSIHMPVPNPKARTSQLDRSLTDEEFRTVAVEGSELNRSYLEWIDRLAVHLAWLQQQGVVAFIRPLHEMNGAWFWYGKRDPGEYKKLFRYTVTHLVAKRGLHNLIVVYSPNRGAGVLDYYPGDGFVDVVGIDTYHEPPVASMQEEYAALQRLNKPFAITEAGWNAQGKTPAGTKDSKREILDALRQTTPRALWWSAWTDSNSPVNQQRCRELYADPQVFTRGTLDWRPKQ